MEKSQKKIVILLVDNYEPHLLFFAEGLRDLEMVSKVLTASSAIEAEEIIGQFFADIDVVISDWNLGKSNGGEVVRYAKQRNSSVKGVIMSIHEHAKELALRCGADDFIDKNNSYSRLEEVLFSRAFLEK